MRGPVVLVFAEDPHDSAAIKTLLRRFAAHLGGVLVETRREPPSLSRTAGERAVRNWLEKVGSLVEAERETREIRAVLVHQDADGPDDAGASLKGQLRRYALDAYAVVPAQEIEAWWLMFPDAVRSVKPNAWRQLKLPVRDTAVIDSPKEELIRLTKACNPKKREAYRELHSEQIARCIVDRDLEPQGRNSSWDRFVKLAESL